MVRDLHRRRGRERRELVLLEGVRLVEEALAAGVPLRGVLVSPTLEATPRGTALKAALAAASPRFEELDERGFSELAATDHPQGVLVVADPPAWSLDQVEVTPATTVLVLEGVQDPGNVGTIVRTALGLGAGGVLALPGTVEFTNPKVLRATMGAWFRLPCVAIDDAGFAGWLERHRVALWAGEREGEPVRGRAGAGALAIAVGNEGAGLRPEVLALATRRVSIPLAPGAESLNVSVAAAILLWEVTRGG